VWQVYRIAASLGVGSSYKVCGAFAMCFCPKEVAWLADDGLRPEAQRNGYKKARHSISQVAGFLCSACRALLLQTVMLIEHAR